MLHGPSFDGKSQDLPFVLVAHSMLVVLQVLWPCPKETKYNEQAAERSEIICLDSPVFLLFTNIILYARQYR